MIKKKKCPKCKEDLPATLEFFALYSKSKSGLQCWCKKCHNKDMKDWVKAHLDNHRKAAKKWRSKNVASHLLHQIKRRSKIMGLQTDLDLKWVQKQLNRGICPLTGLSFDMTIGSPFRPSIDQIKPGQGYTKKNCRIVVWIYNMAKGKWTDESVAVMAEGIVKTRKKNARH